MEWPSRASKRSSVPPLAAIPPCRPPDPLSTGGPPLLLFPFSTTDSSISGLLSAALLGSSSFPRSTVQKSTRQSKASRVHFHFQLPGGRDDTLQEILLLSSRMTRINVRLGVSHRGSLLRGEVLFLRLASRVIAGFYIMNKYLQGLQSQLFFFFFPPRPVIRSGFRPAYVAPKRLCALKATSCIIHQPGERRCFFVSSPNPPTLHPPSLPHSSALVCSDCLR